MAGSEEIKEYVTGFVFSIIGVTVAVNLIPVLLDALNVTGLPALLSATLVGTIVGAGVLLFIVRAFF